MIDRLGNAPTELFGIIPVPDTGEMLGDQTCKMPDPGCAELDSKDLAELLEFPMSSIVSKQERDFAIAALLIRGRHINERAVRNILKSWTPFGKVPLRDILKQKNLVSDETLSRIEQETRLYFQSLAFRKPGESSCPTAAWRTSCLMEQLDPSGTVAKLFGFSQIPKALIGNESRTFRTHFRLIRKLGQGGLGTVWLAVDTSLNRYVAVKEITANHSSDSAAVERFRREAEITGRLDHPSIVPIHLLGENEEDCRVFYVMRFLGNETLADAIREYLERRETGHERPLDFHRLLTAFVSICQAVAYAHSNKVIHRDLKPQNIALDSFGQVIVLDWGLAKTMGMADPQSCVRDMSRTENIDNVDATLAGQVMGSPRFMAPEQAAGRSDEIDERTDVYGLGAILFSILTGYAPHELSQESLAAGSQISDLLDAIVDRPVSRPRSINPNLAVALEAICLKAIAKDRQARYPSAAALSEDVQRWLANQPVSAIQEPFPKRIQRWMVRHHSLARWISLVSMLLIVGAVAWGFTSYQSAVAAEQLKLQSGVDVIHDFRAKLISEIQTLSENTRYMSTLPPVQGIINARRETGTDKQNDWAEQLRVMYRGLLEVHPSYAAITYWEPEGGKSTQPIRVENAHAQRGLQRTDYIEFFGRHLPAITSLARNDIYVGMPGRLVKQLGDASALLPDTASKKDPVGLCMVAGIGVHDDQNHAKAGGVVIECDLEKILLDHLNVVQVNGVKLLLTDTNGRCVMQFTRENGLRPVELGEFSDAMSPLIHSYFVNPRATNILIVSSKLFAAKVPLSRNRAEHFMGLILELP